MGMLEKLKKMQFRELPSTTIETEIDRIYYLVTRLRKATFHEIASKLRIPLGRVEEWAKVLNTQGLLEMQYPLLGEPTLSASKAQKREKKPVNKSRNLLIFTGIASAVMIALIVLLQKGIIKVG